MTQYPGIEEVLRIHEILIDRFGGSMGMRDRAGLESALARAQIGYYQDLIAEAAALWESLSQNHPFIDGNKRTAITVTAAFLRVNGYRLQFEDISAYTFVSELYERNQFEMARLEQWLRDHVAPVPGG